jgi:hypothetical protein
MVGLGLQAQGLCGTSAHAKSATDAAVRIDKINNRLAFDDGIHGATIQAGIAGFAFCGVNNRLVIGSDHPGRTGKLIQVV